MLGSSYVAQAGPELLGSRTNSPASVSRVAGTSQVLGLFQIYQRSEQSFGRKCMLPFNDGDWDGVGVGKLHPMRY